MVINHPEVSQYFGMKVNLCNTSDHLLHSNSQAPQLVPMGPLHTVAYVLNYSPSSAYQHQS